MILFALLLGLLAGVPPPDPRVASEVELRRAEQTEHKDLAAALALARRALAEAVTPRQDIRARIVVARLERERTDYARAWIDVTDAIRRARALRDGDLEAQGLVVLGRIQWTTSELAASIATYRQGLALVEGADDPATQVDLHLGLGVSYLESGDGAGARGEFERALRIARQSGNPESLANALTDVGNSEQLDGRYAEALRDHREAFQIYSKLGDEWGLGTALVNLGSAAEGLGDLPTARDDYRRAQEIFGRLDLVRHLANADRQLAEVLARMGRAAEAQAEFDRALATARRLKSHTVIANIYHDEAAAYEREGRLKDALEAQRRYADEHEAALGQRSESVLAAADARYDAARRDAEISALRAAQASAEAATMRARAHAYGLIGLLLSASVALASVAWSLRSADRFKTRLLGIAAHDLKAPLGNIQQIAEVLREERPDERLDWIAVESTRLLRLVQDLLDTAALEIGRLHIRREPVDLGAAVAAAVADQRWHLQDKEQRLEWSPPEPGAVMIVGDADRLHQVIANLLGNAVKYGPRGSVVTVALAAGAGTCELTVRDEGPGLTAEDRKGLFGAFSRRSARPTGKEKSHGLGLSIAEEIVRLHGGQIGVRSEPGQGAEFFIRLPRSSG
ncbi:MAG TPA: tetratricopeptide repeat-containing sensor histidine kinase [Opitutaceae bacterium]|nr:tetratricopeptide repeat-containing sensor histidine kinase [Opitutaceae bacterium]